MTSSSASSVHLIHLYIIHARIDQAPNIVTDIYYLLFEGNGNDAVLYGTEWTSGPYGTPNRAVKVNGADDQ